MCKREINKTHLSFRFGAPPPTHQSIIALAALSLSALPAAIPLPFSPSCGALTPPRPFSDRSFRASNARMLCKGAPWAMRVSALRRSLRVPPDRMLRRKARSDAEPPVAFGRAEKLESSDACKEDARAIKVAIWEAEWETTG